MIINRLEEIAKFLEKDGSVKVAELSKRLGVSEKTIRQDIKKLEELNIVTRVHGGAVLKKEKSIFPVRQRRQGYLDEKMAIAREACLLIEDGDTVILDSGTTVLELAKLIKQNVIVITNDPLIAHELLSRENIVLYVTGGQLTRDLGFPVYAGEDTIRMLSNYRVKKYFAGVSGFDIEHGLSVFSESEAKVKREMLKCAQQTILLCDYSKFHTQAFTNYAASQDVTTIITDDQISEKDVKSIQNKGINIIIANK